MNSSEDKPAKRGRGRPRQYPAGYSDGAPQVAVRLTPDLLAWVKKRGGATYIRGLIVADLDQTERKAKFCSHCGQQIDPSADQIQVQIMAKETTYFHLDCALPLLSKAKPR